MSWSIRLLNYTAKPQSYLLVAQDSYILESTKNAIVTPQVEAGSSCHISIERGYFVWAKLTKTSEPVFARAYVGSAISINNDTGRLVLGTADGTPEAGCFSITTGKTFNGLFGLAVKIASLGFRIITTAQPDADATYEVETDSSFVVAVNDKQRYKNGDTVRGDKELPSAIRVGFRTQRSQSVVLSHHGIIAERLCVGEEKPLPAQVEELREKLKKMEAEKKGESAAVSRFISDLIAVPSDLTRILGQLQNIDLSQAVGWSDSQRQELDGKIRAFESHKQALAEQLAIAKAETKRNWEVSEKASQELREKETSEKQKLTRELQTAKEQLAQSNRERGELQRQLGDIRAGMRMLEHPADAYGVTPLHRAARDGQVSHIRLLVAGGAKLEARMGLIDGSTDRSYGTPLHWAAIEGQLGAVTALLDAGAEVDARNAWSRTPLHCAARFGHLDVVRLLVGRGADKEALRDTAETPLHFAVEENRYDVVVYLISAGANINARGNRGTPLEFAYSSRRQAIAEYIASHGGHV